MMQRKLARVDPMKSIRMQDPKFVVVNAQVGLHKYSAKLAHQALALLVN